jgi:hypothetical protein
MRLCGLKMSQRKPSQDQAAAHITAAAQLIGTTKWPTDRDYDET